MKLFCRHCWEFVEPVLMENKPHISAICSKPKCNNFIKHLNKSEKTAALKFGLKLKKLEKKYRYKNRQPHGKRTELEENRHNA
jgi:hypothetical protein